MRILLFLLLTCAGLHAQSDKVIIPDSLLALDKNPNFTALTPEAFRDCWASYPNAQLVDVRTAEEYAAGHIAQAINIDVKQADFIQIADSLLDKQRPVAVYCKGGIRSRQAAQQLLKRGFMIYNLQDGYDAFQLKMRD